MGGPRPGRRSPMPSVCPVRRCGASVTPSFDRSPVESVALVAVDSTTAPRRMGAVGRGRGRGLSARGSDLDGGHGDEHHIMMNEVIRRPFYTEYAWAFDLLIDRRVRKECAVIAAWLIERGVLPGAKILDAGCWSGRRLPGFRPGTAIERRIDPGRSRMERLSGTEDPGTAFQKARLDRTR